LKQVYKPKQKVEVLKIWRGYPNLVIDVSINNVGKGPIILDAAVFFLLKRILFSLSTPAPLVICVVTTTRIPGALLRDLREDKAYSTVDDL
jgi:hypothetical protein